MKRLVLFIACSCAVGSAQSTGPESVQGACNAVNTGNGGVVTLTCTNVDKKLADEIRQLVNASRRDEKVLREISERLGELVQRLSTASGSINQSNSGGISVQQATTGSNSPIINSPITIGDLPKTIQPQDMEVLKTFFRSAQNKARIQISADQFSGAQQLPDDFYDALKGGGWTMVDGGVNHLMGFAPPGRRFQGAVILVRGEPLAPNESTQIDPSDPLSYIGRALAALGIARSLNRDPKLEAGLIIIRFEGGFPR
jgi:hypothetical protein